MALLIFLPASHGQGGVRRLVFEEDVLTVRKIGAKLEEPRGIDPFLVEGWRRAPSGDGRIQGLLNSLLVGREMTGREVKTTRYFVVSSNSSVCRKKVGDFKAWQSKKVLQGVLEFFSGEPPQLGADRPGV